MADSKPRLGYWGLRGLCQPIRFLIAYHGLDVDEKRYMAIDDWQAEKFTLGLTFPNVPYWIEEGVELTESKAILKHIAREHGKTTYPSTPAAARTCDMIESLTWDLWTELFRYCFHGLDQLKNYLVNYAPKKMEYLDNYFESRKFILGDQISYVDFILYEMMYHYTSYDADYFTKYPSLARFKKTFEGIPAIAQYITSPAYIKGPCNNPAAKIPI